MRDDRVYLGQFGLRDDDDPTLGVAKERLDFLSRELCVEGDRGGSRGHDSQISYAPFRTVFGKERDTIPRGDLKPTEKGCEAINLICDLAVAPADVLPVPLDLKGDPVLEAGCRLEKLDWDGLGC